METYDSASHYVFMYCCMRVYVHTIMYTIM